MTSIRSWNGTAWVQPSYYWGLRDEWLKYEPAITDYPLRYTFDTDDEQWTGGVTNYWTPGALVMNAPAEETYSYAYSPYFPQHVSLGTSYVAQGHVTLLSCSGALPRWGANVYISGLTDTPEIPTYQFTYVGESVALYMPAYEAEGMLLFPNIQAVIYSAAGVTAQVAMDYIEVSRADGTPITNHKAAKNVPYYWDGTGWRGQTEA